jgi:predicted LPLAT superfamily acyltransferase
MYLGRLVKDRIQLLNGDSELARNMHSEAPYIFARFPWAICSSLELPLPSVVFSVSFNDDATGKHTYVERFTIPKRRHGLGRPSVSFNMCLVSRFKLQEGTMRLL